MRVSELVKSFEDIASSPRSEASRGGPQKQNETVSEQNDESESGETDDRNNELETREPDNNSEIDSGDDSSVISDEAKIVLRGTKKEHASDEQEEGKHYVVSGETRPVDIIVSNSSELTDEISVEVRMGATKESSKEHQERSGIIESNSNNSELTDEVELVDTPHDIEKEFEESEQQSPDEWQRGKEEEAPETHVSQSNATDDEDSSHYDATSRVSYPKVDQAADENQAADMEELHLVHKYTKDSIQQNVCEESRDPEQSTNQDIAGLEELANDRHRTMTSEYGVEKVEKVAYQESLRDSVSSPEPGRHLTPEQPFGTELLRDEAHDTLHSENDFVLTSHKDIDRTNVHELLKAMEESMDERFRRLEEACEQIPLIMEQVQRQVNLTKHTGSASVISRTERTDEPAINIPNEDDVVSKTDIHRILNITSTESIETDVSIMATFPELRAYVHQLESTSTNVIADVLLEDSIKEVDEVLVEETPFDEAPALSQDNTAPLSTSLPSSDLSESNATEMLSKEIESVTNDVENDGQPDSAAPLPKSITASFEVLSESNADAVLSKENDSLTRDAEHKDQSQPLDSVLSNCSSMLAVDVLQPDPSATLNQLVTFLDDQHANLDRVCWGFMCGSHREDSL